MGSSAGCPTDTFCINCHNQNFTSSRFTQHISRGDHRLACFNCHAAIPHGGPRPGHARRGRGRGTAVGGTIAGWDNAAPYWQGGTTKTGLYIVSYPTEQHDGLGTGQLRLQRHRSTDPARQRPAHGSVAAWIDARQLGPVNEAHREFPGGPRHSGPLHEIFLVGLKCPFRVNAVAWSWTATVRIDGVPLSGGRSWRRCGSRPLLPRPSWRSSPPRAPNPAPPARAALRRTPAPASTATAPSAAWATSLEPTRSSRPLPPLRPAGSPPR